MSSFIKQASMIPAIAVGVALSTIAFGGEGGKTSPLGLSLTIGVKQTDNRDAIADDHVVLVRGVEERVEKEDDTELWITPTISLRHEMGDGSRFFISYSPSYTDYDNPRENGMENEWTHSLRADADLYLGPRTKFTLSDNYWWSGQKDWHYGEDYELDPGDSAFDEDDDLTRNDDFYNNRLDTSLSRTLSADDTVRVGAQWRIKRYDDDELAAFRDHLREVVWGHNAEVQSRSLDTHVSRLRNLLNLRAGQPYAISAVYGYGYRLDVPEAAQPAAPAA